MGLNSHYIITIPKANLKVADNFLKHHCKLYENQLDSPIYSTDRCLHLEVVADSAIKKYNRDYYYYGGGGGYQERNLEDTITNGKSIIGCVDLNMVEFGDKVNLSFVCVTSDMSLLFADSGSIRDWFIDLCRTTKAETGIFKAENEYIQLIWFNDRVCDLQVDPEFIYKFGNYMGEKPTLRPIIDLISASFDYSYQNRRNEPSL